MNCKYCNENLDFILKHSCKEELEFWKERSEKLSKVIDAITNIGVYPKEVIGGEAPYTERTEYMNGWNACATETVNEYVKLVKKLKI